MIGFYVDFKIQSPNVKEHWTKAYKRNKSNYLRLISAWRANGGQLIKAPCNVKITRLYNPSKQGKKLDSDNFIASCKSIRDRISGLIIPGLAAGRADDDDMGITFEYAQQEALRATFKIEIDTNV